MKKSTPLFLMAALLLASCSMLGPIDTTLGVAKPLVRPLRDQSVANSAQKTEIFASEQPGPQTTQFFKTPSTPGVKPAAAVNSSAPVVPPNANDETISAVTLDGLPLPQFINTIFATVLKRNVSIDPAVASRTELVSLRTGKPQTAAQLSAAAQSVLKSYGVSVNEFEGLVRVVPAAGATGVSPEILRGRAQPSVPGELRPIFYLVELDNTSQVSVTGWIKALFQGRVTVSEDPARNAIMLSGQSDSVMAAVEVIATLDKPLLRGRYSARFTPVFWSASDMANRMSEVLAAQGYSTSQLPTATTPIIILPIAAVNSVVVFAVSPETLDHALRWAKELDQTPQARSGGRYITYYVRNTDASEVAKTLQEVLGGSSSVSAAAPGGAAAARPSGGAKVVVNTAANSVIMQTTPAEYQQIYSLLQELDRPQRSALIMATVAEVSLTDDEQFGFNWLLAQFNSGGYIVNGGMGPKPSGGATSASGLALNIASIAGDPRALLTALATSSRVRVLSNPSIVAISGQTASIQVGEDVPILTSQISNSSTGTATGQGILQTIQYRNVGIILKVKPVIRSGGRIDLDITQEVSGVSSAATGLGNSPVVTTRKVDTRLSTMDGNTMLIGGLIREQRDGGNAGLPWLKDLPVAGALFRSSANNKITRTELVLLITSHVIEDDFDSRALTDAFRSQFSWGSSIDLSVKEQPIVPPVPQAAPANVDAKREQVAVPYLVPEAPKYETSLQPASAMPRLPVRNVAPSSEMPSLSPSAATTAAPTKAPAQQAPSVAGAPGAPVLDDKLRQELLDAVRGSKK